MPSVVTSQNNNEIPMRDVAWSDVLKMIGATLIFPIRCLYETVRPSESPNVQENSSIHEVQDGNAGPSWPYCEYLYGSVYSCNSCRAHLSSPDEIISKAFSGQGGRAYLLEKCVNIKSGELQQRMLMTGLHTVADIFCLCCGASVGWRYEKAHEPSQRYKEGKFILETSKILLEEA